MTHAPAALDDSNGLPSLPYRVAALSARKPTRFRFRPEAPERAAMAAALGLLELRHLDFSGEITPVGRHDYKLSAQMDARIVQSCVISLAPVPGNLAEAVTRSYIRDYRPSEADELELSAEEDAEPLPEVIDLAEVALEALALALPLYPRAKDVALGQAEFAPPGAEPIRESDLKPFAGLAGLTERLKGKDESQG